MKATPVTTPRFVPDAVSAGHSSTDELRAGFLVQNMFVPGQIVLHHTDLDRVVLGGAVPLDQPLRIIAPESFAAAYFAERRELGLLNVGPLGAITVDGTRYPMAGRDLLYVGRGSREITFESDDARKPAKFYLVSYPAHATHQTARVTESAAETTELGTADRANRRRLAKYVHPGGAASAQLVMGVTTMAGGVWNTMPPHTHGRRSEVYLYFDLPDDAVVVHLMGEPRATRHLIVRNGEVVLSPPWSVHAGCGTAPYAFCWAMGGENQDFTDMQAVDMRELK